MATKANHVFPEIVRSVEERAQELGFVVTLIEHPDASGEVFEGTYGGFPTKKEKKARARLSDGSWIDI